MVRILMLLAALVGRLAAPTPGVTIGDDLTVRQIQDGAYIITHAYPWPANSLLVEMASGDLVLVDTPYTPEATQTLLDWIAATFGARDMVAIDTGFHVDNLGGNSALIAAGIPVYGSDRIPELLDERGEASRALMLSWLSAPADRRYRDGLAAVPFVAPDHLFPLADGLVLEFGDEQVRVIFPGETHTPDNVVVYFPDRKLMFGGCMILAGDKIGNTADATMSAWADSVRQLDAFAFTRLVPGHGDRYDRGLLAHTLSLLAAAP